MFSGIIENVGTIKRSVIEAGNLSLDINTGFPDLTLGESVAVNGVCLTVVTFDAAGFANFFASAETLARTNIGALRAGSVANLERAVALSTRLSGHVVQGHVDGFATLSAIQAEAGAHKIWLQLPPALARYCVEKGSIALDGISLTLNSVEDHPDGGATIGLTIIPHTWTHTNLQTRKSGDVLNVEVDILAKYVERLCKTSN